MFVFFTYSGIGIIEQTGSAQTDRLSVSNHGLILVIITDDKSCDLHLKEYHIEYASPKIKYFPIEFDIDCINGNTNYT